MSFPSLYRARATHINQDPKPDGSTTIVVFVPAVFGEEPILVSDAVGSLPTSPEMGWVLFQAGNPEFPVWVGKLASAGGGTGTDEVWVGPDDPGGSIEVWYDTDATPADPSWGRWSGAQAAYDAITSKDPNTLYVVLSPAVRLYAGTVRVV